MDRIYNTLILNHLKSFSQMAFIVGPRQVGKTTLARSLEKHFKESRYFNWDVVKDRTQMLTGQDFIEEIYPINVLREQKPLIIFDEIHKYKYWKNYLKGFFDYYKDHFHIVVTGSARLDLYQSSGDSLMGRYFQYRVHPLSVREMSPIKERRALLESPYEIEDSEYNALYKYGGFPEPLLQRKDNFYSLWQATRNKQLIYEDIQSVEKINDITLLEVLAELLKSQAGQMLNRTKLSSKVGVTVQTVVRWISALEKFYYCFLIKPWSNNVTRSLIKEPKLYMWDWSVVEDEGAKNENFIASHLLKFAHYWSDLGKYEIGIYYLRDIDKREVDFLVTKEKQPWFTVEAKSSPSKTMKLLEYFHSQLNTDYDLEVVQKMEYVNKSCFEHKGKMRVPARTFLSQLV